MPLDLSHQDTTKPTNPKDLLGTNKLPLHLWPSTATALGCIALLNGALKYGRTNWRVSGVRATVYLDAAMRHITAYLEGEEVDPDDGVPHLGAALASLAIVADAMFAGTLEDDRPYPGGYVTAVVELTPHVRRLHGHHAGRVVRHITIKDYPVA